MKSPGSQFDIDISEDKMAASIGSITPPGGSGGPVTVESVARALADAHIVFGIDKKAVERLVKEVAATGALQKEIMVAAGEQARAGTHARIEMKIGPNAASKDPRGAEIVKPGQILAIKVAATKGKPGRNIFGEEVPAPGGNDMELSAGENAAIRDDGNAVVASAYGIAREKDHTVSVTSLIKVSSDKMSAEMSLFPTLADNSKLTMEDVTAALKQAGVVFGVQERVIQEALGAGEPIKPVRVAQGRVATRGQDARIEFKISTDKSTGRLVEGTGRMDFRERETIKNVKAGDVVAVKVPCTPGEDGVDVFGRNIPAAAGADTAVTLTGNVAVSEDGLTFTSQIDGMVVLTRDRKIGVFKEYQLSGDVDFSTGNLTMDGSLDIKGWIKSGFSVRASGDIRVGRGVEDAVLEAGGNIYVNGGIIGAGEGRIHAGGDLEARFFENVRAHADGDIKLRDDAMYSVFSANGRVVMTEGKGRIRGGSVKAQRSIEANEIGSEMGVHTRVSVGTDPGLLERIAEVTKKLAELKRNEVKIDRALAPYVRQGKGKELPKDMVRKLAKVVKLRRGVVDEKRRLAEYREKLALEMSETYGKHITVKVKKAVYAGTTVVVSGYAYYVKDDIRGKTTFFLNLEKKAVELTG